MDLVDGVYTATRAWTKEELYGLTSQIRRAVVSVPSNIAEGQARGAPKEFHRFLRIAHGSLRELETQVLIAQRQGYLPGETTARLLNQAGEVGRLINGLSRSLHLD
jgi:four helix bundle protein